ncbi:MAG: Ig domain-containing protein, partial [Rudanella sp.]|nr:Ig domain-containing protein [Rudanella sp.]
MARFYGSVFLLISWLGQSVGLAQCPAAVSIRISQVNLPTELAYNSFCQGEQVQLNLVGDQPGLTYQWKLNGQHVANGTSATYLASATGFYTITVNGPNKCTITSLPVSIDVNDCQPTGRARIRGVYLEDFNGDASVVNFQNPFLRLGFLTYKSDLAKFPQQVRVTIYQKSNDRLMATLNLQRISKLERNLLSLDAACGIESTQLYDVLYFLVTPSGDPVPFNFDPAIYNDPGGYYLVSEGVCCRETADNVAGPDDTVIGYMELSARQRFNVNNTGSMFGTVFNLVSKVEACTGKPLTIDYFDARNAGGIIRVANATIQSANVTRTQYSLASPRTTQSTPAFRDVTFNPGYSDNNFAGPGNGLQIDPNTGTITGTPTRPGTFAYVVKAETYNGSTRLSEIRRELQVIVKECPPNPQPKLILTEVSRPSVPTSNTFCPGKIAQLNVLGDIPDGKLQWQLNGKTIAGATSSTLLVEQEGTYTVSVEKATSCPPFALSDPLTITVIASSVSLTSGISSGTDCQNTVTQLVANASEPNATFRWLLNGAVLPGIT